MKITLHNYPRGSGKTTEAVLKAISEDALYIARNEQVATQLKRKYPQLRVTYLYRVMNIAGSHEKLIILDIDNQISNDVLNKISTDQLDIYITLEDFSQSLFEMILDNTNEKKLVDLLYKTVSRLSQETLKELVSKLQKEKDEKE